MRRPIRRELARRVLRENRGGRALIVGHSNTVPEIVAALARVRERAADGRRGIRHDVRRHRAHHRQGVGPAPEVLSDLLGRAHLSLRSSMALRMNSSCSAIEKFAFTRPRITRF